MKKKNIPEISFINENIEVRTLSATKENAERVWDAIKEESCLAAIKNGGIYMPCHSAADMQDMMASQNKLFERDGFNFYILRGDKVIGNIHGELTNLSQVMNQVSDFAEQMVPKSYEQDGAPTLGMEVYYYLSKEATGNGFMQQALRMVEDYHFQHSEAPLYLNIYDSNAASQKTAKAAGFKLAELLMSNDYYFVKTKADWEDSKPVFIAHHTDNNVAQTQENERV